MPAPKTHTSSGDFSTQVDAACDALEAAWQQGATPDWRDFIAGDCTDDHQLCCTDLIAVDMEWRQKAQLPVRAEDYLAHIPGEPSPDVQASIIGHEYELRQRRGDKSGPEEYFQRFPELSDVLSTMFPKDVSTSNQRANSSPPEKRMKPTADELTERLTGSGILDAEQVESLREATGLTAANVSGETLAKQLVKKGKLTKFQAQLAYNDKAKNLVMGSYVILEKLGEGGMGQVYKARHKRMKREVALKVLAPQFVKDELALQRFHREVEAAARLNHANIVTAHDADEARGTHYLVMELVSGDDLSELIKKSGPLPVTKAVDCILQAAKGLAYAHGQNVVHRDIKPANLLLDKDGTVKILDMGLARFDETGNEDIAGAALTGTGMLMGTVDYMAPEQALDSKTADHRADIYSLGCTLYFLLTGKPMYGEDTVMKRVMAHQNAAIPQLPGDDKELQTLFEHMVAKKAEGRLEPAEEVVAALEAWQNAHLGEATQPVGSAAVDIAIAPDDVEHSVVSAANDQSVSQSAETVLKASIPGDTDQSTDSSAFDATIVPSNLAEEVVAATDDETEPLPEAVSARGSGGKRNNGRLLLAGAGGLAAIFLLGAIIFRFTGKDGTVVVKVEGDLDVATVEIDDKQVSFSPDGTDKRLTFKVDPGNHKLTLKTADGLELTTDLGKKPLEIKAGGDTTLRAWVESKQMSDDPIMSSEDPDRAAAEWVLSMPQGNRFVGVVVAPGKQLNISDLDELPKVPFRVVQISIYDDVDVVLTDSDLNRITSLPDLQTLVLLARTKITDAGIAALSNMPKSKRLGNLHIWAPAVTNASVQFLNRIRSLSVLTLRDAQITDEGLLELRLPSLIELKLAGGGVSPAGFDGFMQRLPNLKGIDLRECRLQRDIDFSPLIGWTRPDALLKLYGTNIDDDGLGSLGQLTNFSGTIDLRGSNHVTDIGLAHLENLTHMTALSISGNNLTEAGVLKLQAALPNRRINGLRRSDDGHRPDDPTEPDAAVFPRPEYDSSPLPKLGTWEPGPQPPWDSVAGRKIKAGDVLPGILLQPAKLPGIKRWNVETFWPRGIVPVARYSPDGHQIAVSSYDGHMRLYDSQTLGTCMLLPGEGFSSGVRHVAWHPDSKLIAVVDAKSTLRLWTTDGNCLFESGVKGGTAGLAWIDKERLAVAIGNPQSRQEPAFLVVYNRTGNVVDQIAGGESFGVRNRSLSWNAALTQFACVHADSVVRIWDMASKSFEILCEGGAPNNTVAWSRADWIAVDVDTEIQLYGPDRKLQQTVPFSMEGPCWDPDGTKLFLADAAPHVWDVTSAGFIAPADKGAWAGNGSSSLSSAHDWSPAGDRIIRAAGRLDIFDAELKTRLAASPQFLMDKNGRTSWSPDGQRLATINLNHGGSTWSTTGIRLDSFEPGRFLTWSPDSQTLYSGQGNGFWSRVDDNSFFVETTNLNALGRISSNGDGTLLAAAANTKDSQPVIVIMTPRGEIIRTIAMPEKQGPFSGRHKSVDWSAVSNRILVKHGGVYNVIDPADEWSIGQIAADNRTTDAFWSPDGMVISDYMGQTALDGSRVAGNARGAVAWRPDGVEFLDSWYRLANHDEARLHLPGLDFHGNPSECVDWNSARALLAISDVHSEIRTLDATDLTPYWHAILLPDEHTVTFTGAGQILDGDRPIIDQYIRYYVETDDDRIETLTPTEFEKRIGQSLYVTKQAPPLIGETTDAPEQGATESRAALGSDERKELLNLLRSVIRVDTGRMAQVNAIDDFLKNPSAEKWSGVRKQATANTTKLRKVITQIEELNGDFIVDEMDTYRELMIDLDTKAKVYEELLQIDGKEALTVTDRIKTLADQHSALILKLQSHEAAIQKYLQTNK